MLAKGSPEAQAHAASLVKMRAEYDALVAGGNIEAARAKLAEMGAALKAMDPAAVAAAKALAKVDAASAATKAAAAEHAKAIATLRAEYAAQVASGNWQLAAEKMQQINAALRETPGVARDAAAATSGAAAAIAAAYKDLSITTDAELRATAERAKGNFDLLASSGAASARELGLAFADAAKKAIDANNGIAPSWVNAQAGARGYRVEVDAAGQASVVAKQKASAANSTAVDGHAKAAGAAGAHAEAVDGVARAYDSAGAAAGGAANKFEAVPSDGGKTFAPSVEPMPTNGKDLKGFSSEAQKKKYSMSEPEPPKEKKTGGDGTIIPVFETMAELDTYVERWKADFREDNREFIGSTEYIWYQRMMDQAHKKAAQALKSREAVKEAGRKAAEEKAKAEKAEERPLPAPTPSPQKSSSGAAPTLIPSPAAPAKSAGGGNTYISNITLPSGRKETVRFADAQSQSVSERLLRDLAAGKGVAQ